MTTWSGTRRATLTTALVLALPGCGLLFRTIDRSERVGAARYFPAAAADVFFLGEIPVLAPLLLLDLPLSLAVDVVLLPATVFHALYESERRPRPAPRVAPAPVDDVRPVDDVEEAPPPVVSEDPPQLRLGSGQTD